MAAGAAQPPIVELRVESRFFLAPCILSHRGNDWPQANAAKPPL